MNLIIYGLPEQKTTEDGTKWDNKEKVAADTEILNNIIVDDLAVPLSPRTGIIEVRHLGFKYKSCSLLCSHKSIFVIYCF